MKPTKWWVLTVVALVVGVVAYLVTKSNYASLPSPHVYSALYFLILAVAEGYIAFFTRARLSGQAGTRPINPLVVARCAALAKASSLVGAVFAGLYAGFLGWVAQVNSPTATSDLKAAIAWIVTSAGVVGAALFLETVCRVPKDDEPEAGRLPRDEHPDL
jgi:hypothetical protein